MGVPIELREIPIDQVAIQINEKLTYESLGYSALVILKRRLSS